MAAGFVVWRRLAALVVVAAAAAGLAGASVPSAAAPAPPAPWDGTNPFHCTVQNAGQGTAVPDPGADPYCVHFDKTGQNVTQLGLVDFLLKEPARVAAAVPKCFYYQEDHWRGSLTPGGPALYEFTGHYFFNKATGDGGVWVTGFTVAGQTFDPTSLPGFPPGYGQYFGPGTGGVITHDDIPADPRCVALAHAQPVYSAPANVPRCVAGGGSVAAGHVGPAVIGAREDRVRALLGPPAAVKRGWLHWCVARGGELLVGQPGDRSGTLGSGGRAPTVIALTTSRVFTARGTRGRVVAVGARSTALRRAFPRQRRVLRLGGMTILTLARGVLAGTSGGRVRYLAVIDRRALRRTRTLASYLRRAG